MSNPQLTPLQAKHIVEAQSHYEEASKVLKEATEALTRAEANLNNATGDRAPFEANVREKKQSVADATVRFRYERECLTRLLDIKPPKPWSYIFFGILGAAVLGTILWGMLDDTLLVMLREVETSRGLITFLITLVTVTIALILTLSTIVSASPDRSERFKDGKDLLFALIGVLGTIVGFYFGQLGGRDQQLHLATPVLTNDAPTAGETVSLITFITGGEAPYTYEITFAPNEPLEAVTPTQSNEGLVRKDILIPNVEKETEVTYTVTVKDKNGEEISSDGNTITLSPGPAPGDAVPSDESIPDHAEGQGSGGSRS